MTEAKSTTSLTPDDPIVWRRDLQNVLNVSTETVRRWLNESKLPKPDINPTRQCMGWRRSTLRASGFDLGDQA